MKDASATRFGRRTKKTDEQKRFDEDTRVLASTLSSRYATAILLKTKAQGRLLKDVAATLGVTKSALTQSLRSENLTFETATRLARALDCEFSVALDAELIQAELLPDDELESGETDLSAQANGSVASREESADTGYVLYKLEFDAHYHVELSVALRRGEHPAAVGSPRDLSESEHGSQLPRAFDQEFSYTYSLVQNGGDVREATRP